MCENENPKVIVDDDFLDLRNDQGNTYRRRPLSSHSITRGSSVNTQGNVSTTKEVLPGLQRFLNTYGQKKSNSFGYKKSNRTNAQPVDCRFRRKVEKKVISSRSTSILQENEREEQKKTSESHISEVSSVHNHSSESGKTKNGQKIQPTHSQISLKDEKCSKIAKTKKPTRIISESKKKEDKESPGKNNLQINDVMKECKKEFEQQMKKAQTVLKKDILDGETLDPNKFSTNNNKTKFQLEDPRLPASYGYYLLPTFKKSWTIPSLPLLKRQFPWAKHYNALCAKVDRKTYEFDTEESVSDSEDNVSAYSTISTSNFMNLIFCLGCICGIFLIGGILTASEIQADYFRPMESEMGMVEFIYGQFTYMIRVIFSVFHRILTLPGTKLFRSSVEQPGHWSFFNKYLYFIPQ
ncbi:uncharacterized protein LOC123686012 [Harmonia axyridis]|uniref:uncharacterized protein LOC123686012 n=1 Tax=Harmonia axyridis TaxID=115357 RepID=UPI001E275328|nr:uncharacterized protein LOC123686012 [Harmonia axyridis]